MKATAYCDGRGNAGTGACATVITLEDGTVIEEARRLGGVTNNVAEYEAVLLTIEFALQYGVSDLSIRSDSQIIVRQLEGKYKVKQDHLRPLRDKVWEEAEKFEKISIKWVRREENRIADALCRKVDKDPSPRKNPFRR